MLPVVFVVNGEGVNQKIDAIKSTLLKKLREGLFLRDAYGLSPCYVWSCGNRD